MKALLDTNICIYIIKRKPPQVFEAFNAYGVEEIGVSSITVGELMHGVSKSQRREQNLEALNLFLAPLAIAPFDYEAAVRYGDLRAHLERSGQIIGSMDMLIAAHALSLGIPLVTNNAEEFSRVPDLVVRNRV